MVWLQKSIGVLRTSTMVFGQGLSCPEPSRFQGFMAFLQLVSPAAETARNKLHKVESFVDYFKSWCVALYQRRKRVRVAIDERMVKSRHRCGIKQHMKSTPIKWGIKLWVPVLADSSNGYTIDFNIYIGKACLLLFQITDSLLPWCKYLVRKIFFNNLGQFLRFWGTVWQKNCNSVFVLFQKNYLDVLPIK